jgi:tRNA pseudouridine13 synthase
MAIKRSPADFEVEEFLRDDLLKLSTDAGPFALYRLKKEVLATPEAVAHAARQLKLPPGAIAYAGLKDKHAKTTQHVTLKVANPEEGPEQAPERSEGPGWSLERLGFVPRPITSSDIRRNRFRITLRNLTTQDAFDMTQAAELLKLPGGQLRITNYFGDQRFGSARHGRGFIGKHLVKGDFEGAVMLAIATEARKDRMDQKVFKRTLRENWGQWKEVLPKLRPCPERRVVERLVNSGKDFRAAFCALPYLLQQLSVYAYQSHLWNAIVRRFIAAACGERGKVLAAEDPFGEMLFPSAEATPEEIAALEIPLLAKKSELIEPWKTQAEEVLREEGVEVSELHIAGVRRPFFGEEPRGVFFTTEDFELMREESDETANDRKRRKRTVVFSLPPGSYATVLLRALGQ